MAKKVYEESKIKAIADAIREKTGGDETYTTSQMPNGVNKVYRAGRDAMWNELWDSMQEKGNKNEYAYFFMNWPATTFYPKYDIKLVNTNIHNAQANIGVFRSFNSGGSADFDMSARLEECGVSFSTSTLKSLQYFIMSSNVKRIPPIDMSSAINTYMTFYASKVQIIDKLIFSETTTPNANMFAYCSLLKTISEVEGTIAKNISFKDSPLDVPTMNRIIEHLKVQSSGTYTLTLKADRQNLLSNEMKTLATNKGWTLVWS